MLPAVTRLIATLLDVVIVVAALIVFYALAIGGTLSIGTIHIGLRSADNPVLLLGAAMALRYACRTWPGLGILSRAAAGIDRFSADTLSDFHARVMSARWVLAIALITLILKIWFAASSPGFFSGDDVEVHEMTLSALLGARWPIWDLRSPVFPLGVVYPAQWLAHAAGIRDVGALVVAGRLAVAIASTASVFLVAAIGRRLWPDQPSYALLAAAIFAFAQLSIAFGSSELPRPVASVFLLAAFLLILRGGAAAAIVAGIFVGIAASFRFSEMTFVVPAAIHLWIARRKIAGVAVVAAAAGTLALLIGLGDRAYWGGAFHSAYAAFDYTIVRQLSSRGYQPAWWYLTALGQWTTLPVFVLAVAGARRFRVLALWAFLPLLFLSLIPHKEARYAIPSLPFVCLLAAEGVRRVAQAAAEGTGRPWHAVAVVVGLALGALHDIGHYRLPRSNAEVRFARRVAGVACPDGLVVQQLWRLGGRLYLPQRPLVDLDPAQMESATYLPEVVPRGAAVMLDTRRGVAAPTASFLRDRAYGEPIANAGAGYTLWVMPAEPGK